MKSQTISSRFQHTVLNFSFVHFATVNDADRAASFLIELFEVIHIFFVLSMQKATMLKDI